MSNYLNTEPEEGVDNKSASFCAAIEMTENEKRNFTYYSKAYRDMTGASLRGFREEVNTKNWASTQGKAASECSARYPRDALLLVLWFPCFER